jgi:hypothetical protein
MPKMSEMEINSSMRKPVKFISILVVLWVMFFILPAGFIIWSAERAPHVSLEQSE